MGISKPKMLPSFLFFCVCFLFFLILLSYTADKYSFLRWLPHQDGQGVEG